MWVLCQKKHASQRAFSAKAVPSTSTRASRSRHYAALTPGQARELYPSLQRLSEHLVLRSSSKSTSGEYMRYGIRICEWAKMDPSEMTEDQVRAFFVDIKSQGRYSPNTVRLMTAGLRCLFMHVLNRTDWSIFTLIHSPDVQRLPFVLTEPQIRDLLGATVQPYMRLLFELMLGTGLRVSEAVSLELSQVRGKGQAHQSLVVLGKGNKERSIPLPPSLYAKLGAHWLRHHHPRWMFPSPAAQRSQRQPNGNTECGHVSASALQQAMVIIREQAGLPETTGCHTLRHTYATMALEAGVNLLQVSRYLGHESIETTQIYLHLTLRSEKSAIEAIEQSLHRILNPPR